LFDTLKLSRLAQARSAGAKRGNLDLHGGLLHFKDRYKERENAHQRKKIG
jgi:hypothetical protein